MFYSCTLGWHCLARSYTPISHTAAVLHYPLSLSHTHTFPPHEGAAHTPLAHIPTQSVCLLDAFS